MSEKDHLDPNDSPQSVETGEPLAEGEKQVAPSTSRETVKQLDQSYWGIVKRQFRKNRMAVWSLRVVYLIIFVGVFADFLANDKPIYVKIDGKGYWPITNNYMVDLGLGKKPEAFLNIYDWHQGEYDRVIWAPIPWSPQKKDFTNSLVAPFGEQQLSNNRFKHLLGTDDLGRDLFAGLIHGTRIAMLVGIISMAIASVIGIILGAIAGYFGDSRMKVSRIRVFLNIIFVFFAVFYSVIVRNYVLSDSLASGFGPFIVQVLISMLIFFGIMLIPNLISIVLKRIAALGKKMTIPVDILISRTIEIFISIPRLLLILSVAAVIEKPDILLIMVIIGVFGWMGIARLVRGELLRVRSLEYIEAAQSLGYNEGRIIFRHAIPNSLTSALIAIAFGVASAILVESSLSFLGIGVQADVMTWGKLLNMARSFPTAWWLALFPGFAIFITVTVFNLLGEGLTTALDPKAKQ